MTHGSDFDDDRDFLLIERKMAKGLECRFIPKEAKNGHKLTKDPEEFETLFIPNEDFYEIEIRSTGEIISFYKYSTTHLKEVTENPDQTIAKLLMSQIKHYFKNPGRNVKTEIRETLESLPGATILDELKKRYQCNDEVAQKYFSNFLNNVGAYLEGMTIPDHFLRRAIDCNDTYKEKIIGLVKQEWEEKNAALKKEIFELEQRQNNLVQQGAKLESQITAQKGVLTALETAAKEKQKEIDSFSEKLKSRINESRQDVSSFLSEFTFLSSVIGTQSERPTAPAAHVFAGKTISDDPETLNDDDELLEVTADNLKAIGVTMWSKQLARYLLGAYKARVPLIIAGPQCVDVLNAFSASFTNHSASIIEMTDNCDLSNLPSLDENGVVGLFNVLGTPLFGPFCRRIRSHKSYICLLADTAEELAIEPRGIYSYALPLFTDFFIEQTVTSTPELTGAIYEISRALPEKDSKKEDSKPSPLPSYIISQQAFMNCQCLYDYATQGLGSEKERREFGYFVQTLPLMLSLNYRDELLELIDGDADLDTKAKTVLAATCGVPNE